MKELEDMRNDELLTVIIAGIQILRDNEHKQGFEDGQKEKPQAIYEMKVEEYNKGLNEAWECAKKLCQSEKYGGLQEHCAEIFGREDVFDVFDYSASECIEKLMAYQKRKIYCNHTTEEIAKSFIKDVSAVKDQLPEHNCEDCKRIKDPIFYGHCVGECDYAKQTEDIKVGDEVIVQVDRIGFVTGFDVLFDRVYVTTKDGWSDAFGRSFVKKTGRHFDEIEKVLEQMKGDQE